MKLYLAGPMRGYKDFNFPAFMKAAEELRAQGHEVFNPAEKDIEAHGPDVNKSETGNLDDIKNSGFDMRDAILADLTYIIREAEGIVMLPGWEKSKGANAEYWTAQFLGLKVMEYVGA